MMDQPLVTVREEPRAETPTADTPITAQLASIGPPNLFRNYFSRDHTGRLSLTQFKLLPVSTTDSTELLSNAITIGASSGLSKDPIGLTPEKMAVRVPRFMLQVYIHCEKSMFRSAQDIKNVIAWGKTIIGSPAIKSLLERIGLGEDYIRLEIYDSLATLEVTHVCPYFYA